MFLPFSATVSNGTMDGDTGNSRNKKSGGLDTSETIIIVLMVGIFVLVICIVLVAVFILNKYNLTLKTGKNKNDNDANNIAMSVRSVSPRQKPADIKKESIGDIKDTEINSIDTHGDDKLEHSLSNGSKSHESLFESQESIYDENVTKEGNEQITKDVSNKTQTKGKKTLKNGHVTENGQGEITSGVGVEGIEGEWFNLSQIIVIIIM